MRAISIVLVNAKNETLREFSPNESAAVVGRAYVDLRKSEGVVHAVRRLVDSAGSDVSELISAYAESCGRAGRALGELHLEVWHTKRSTGQVPATVNKAEYDLVARISVPAALGLEAGYSATQSIDFAWNPLHLSRSTSVGDVLVTCETVGAPGAASIVARLGFEAIEFLDA